MTTPDHIHALLDAVLTLAVWRGEATESMDWGVLYDAASADYDRLLKHQELLRSALARAEEEIASLKADLAEAREHIAMARPT